MLYSALDYADRFAMEFFNTAVYPADHKKRKKFFKKQKHMRKIRRENNQTWNDLINIK